MNGNRNDSNHKNKYTIAIVEDDLSVGNMLEELLQKNGYTVLRAYSGTEAVMLLEKKHPSLILLDLMLPGLPGEAVLAHIKNIPVIVLSAKIDVQDKVQLLLSGAVDYVTKPFDTKELLARIQAHLRNMTMQTDTNVLVFSDITMDLRSYEVFITEKHTGRHEQIKLTRTEYAILKTLMKRPDQVITKSQILDAVSEETPDCTDNSLKMHISNLRKKLRSVNETDYIEAVWGIGFKMRREK